MARKTHHKHSSTKGCRRLLDARADLDDVHGVAIGRVVTDRPAEVEAAMGQHGWTSA